MFLSDCLSLTKFTTKIIDTWLQYGSRANIYNTDYHL